MTGVNPSRSQVRREQEQHQGNSAEKHAHSQAPAARFIQNMVPLVMARRAIDQADDNQQDRQMPKDGRCKKRRVHAATDSFGLASDDGSGSRTAGPASASKITRKFKAPAITV